MAERRNLLEKIVQWPFCLAIIAYDFAGSRKPITPTHLKAVTNDVVEAENRTIIFTVANRPKLGRLITVLSDNSTRDVSSFTQSMVSVRFTVGHGIWVSWKGFCVCFTWWPSSFYLCGALLCSRLHSLDACVSVIGMSGLDPWVQESQFLAFLLLPLCCWCYCDSCRR